MGEGCMDTGRKASAASRLLSLGLIVTTGVGLSGRLYGIFGRRQGTTDWRGWGFFFDLELVLVRCVFLPPSWEGMHGDYLGVDLGVKEYLSCVISRCFEF